MRNSYQDSLEYYKTVKTSLKSIVKSQEVIDKIEKAVININQIIFHIYNFLKLFYLSENTYPVVNPMLIKCIIKILFKKSSGGRKQDQKNIPLMTKLQNFYQKSYKKYMPKNVPSYTYLNNVIEYEIVGIITNFKNHIQLHFWDFLNKYINIFSCKDIDEFIIKNNKELSNQLKTRQTQILRNEVKKIKEDIHYNTNKCSPKYNYVKDLVKSIISKHKIKLNNLDEQIENNTLNFLPILVDMSKDIEDIKKNCDEHEIQQKLKPINCFPLRKSLKPKYIKIDTATVVYLLFGKNIRKYTTKGNLVKHTKGIWKRFFKTDKNEFKRKDYIFNNIISTDGIGCSILLIKKNLYNPKGKTILHSVKKPFNYVGTKYVGNLKDEEKNKFLTYKKVGIDPGKDDLIYATNGKIHFNGKKHVIKTFRYTQNQRRFETKAKIYQKRIHKYKKKIVGNNSIIKHESELSFCNSSSCDIETVKKYIQTKTKLIKNIKGHYNDTIYRKQKWFAFINRQRSEAKMINNFKKKFGDGSKTIILMGDFQENNHMKYKEPTKGKGFRNLFKKAGYNVFLVDEYNTSKICHVNGNEMENFREIKNPRVFAKKKTKLCHGLLRSKTVPNNKSIIMNRDTNGSLNIRLKGILRLLNKKCTGKLRRLEREFQGHSIDVPTLDQNIRKCIPKVKKNKPTIKSKVNRAI